SAPRRIPGLPRSGHELRHVPPPDGKLAKGSGMRIVVIGATSAIAEHCCRLWVAREVCDLVLVARDAAKAGRVAADLRVRSPASTIGVIETDFLDAAAIGRLASETAAQPIDIVLIAHGALPEQSACENDLLVCRDTLEVNAVSPALFAE